MYIFFSIALGVSVSSLITTYLFKRYMGDPAKEAYEVWCRAMFDAERKKFDEECSVMENNLIEKTNQLVLKAQEMGMHYAVSPPQQRSRDRKNQN